MNAQLRAQSLLHKNTTVTRQRIRGSLSLKAFFPLNLMCCVRSEKSTPGFHESMFCSLQALRDKEFSIFDETMKQARCGRYLDTLLAKIQFLTGKIIHPSMCTFFSTGVQRWRSCAEAV